MKTREYEWCGLCRNWVEPNLYHFALEREALVRVLTSLGP